ncbi:MAG: hypothetical protein AABW91_03270 [Nanoarchaeota archaeon]
MMDLSEFKKFFLFSLIGSLIISALVAVVTVIIGKFNEITARVLFTLFMVVLHSLVSLTFIWDDEKQNTFERLSLFINIIFFIIVLSFITSILGIWKVIPTDIVWNLYQTYFIVAFAALHVNILVKALNKERYIDMIVYFNYIFIGIVVLMLLPIIYLSNAFNTLGEIYYRILAAVGIIDGTLSILAIIFYKLYLHKHPKSDNPLQGSQLNQTSKKKGLSIWVWILIIYLIIQIVSFISLFGFRMFR